MFLTGMECGPASAITYISTFYSYINHPPSSPTSSPSIMPTSLSFQYSDCLLIFSSLKNLVPTTSIKFRKIPPISFFDLGLSPFGPEFESLSSRSAYLVLLSIDGTLIRLLFLKKMVVSFILFFKIYIYIYIFFL